MRRLFTLPTLTIWMALAVAPLPAVAADWTELFPSTSPDPRFGHSVTTVGPDVYLFGGQTAPGVEENDLWRWDRYLDTWVELFPTGTPPAVRFMHGAASVGGRLYVAYGLNVNGPLSDIYEYDPLTNAWSEIVIAGPIQRHQGGLAALSNGMLFLAGGYSDAMGMTPLLDAWILDPIAETGDQIADLPAGLVGFSAGASGPAPLVYGGWLAGSSTFNQDLLIWNPLPAPDGTWDVVVPGGASPVSRTGAATVQLLEEPIRATGWGDSVIIIGGEGSSKAVTGTPTTTSQLYDIAGNDWSYGEDMPLALVNCAAAVLPPTGGAGNVRLEVLLFGGLFEGMGGLLTPTDRTFLYLSEAQVTLDTVFVDGFEAGNTTQWSAEVP